MDSKSIGNKSKNRQVGLHQIKKCFCAAKETIKRVKGQPPEWEKTFSSYLSDRGLTYRIYKRTQNIIKQKNE
jgi:hypothetical protein